MKAIFSVGLFILLLTGVWYLGFQAQSMVWDTISGWFSDEPQTELSSPPKTFQCKQRVPEFTLGFESDPSEVELTELCDCIWEQLTPWARQAAEQITKGERPTVPTSNSEANTQAFIAKFGMVMQTCGANRL